MKITQYRNDGKKQTQRTMELEAGLEAMRTETKSQPISNMRELLTVARPGEKYDWVKRVPMIIFGCALRKDANGEQIMNYNGLITLEVNKLAGRKEAAQIRTKAKELPQTLLAFIGSSNKTVKIIVPFTLPDGKLPQTREQIEMFHAQAYREAVKWYQPQLNREIELKRPMPEQGCRMTFDPNLYHNPQAVAIRIEQPIQMPAEPTYEERRQAIANPLQRLLPGYERHHIIATLFSTSLNHALEQTGGIEDWTKELLPFFIKLAENCYLSGIPEEDAVRWTLKYNDLEKYEIEIRSSFHTAYIMKRRFGSHPCIPAPMTLVAQLEEFMQRRYHFRYNTLKGVVEYRELKSLYFDFRPLTRQTMNSIGLNAQYEGLTAWDADIKRYLESDRVPAYNPIEEYLYNAGEWDGRDRIREMASRIECDNPEIWCKRFHTWFLSMVAHWLGMDKKHANSTLPLLIGEQGCGKSTFCFNLMPNELRDYYTDSIDLSKRQDTERALGRFLLINMDEFDSISPSYQGFMKHIIQKAIVQTRRPYGSVTEQVRRYATFMATSNNHDLLNDPTGSRRFICIEVKGLIENTQPIDYRQLYAQAVEELKNGVRYWFTHEDEAQITADNLRFQRNTLEEEACFLYFRQPQPGEAFEELTCVEILERIKSRQKGFKYTNKTVIQLGRVLKAQFSCRRVHRGAVYRVMEIRE